MPATMSAAGDSVSSVLAAAKVPTEVPNWQRDQVSRSRVLNQPSSAGAHPPPHRGSENISENERRR